MAEEEGFAYKTWGEGRVEKVRIKRWTDKMVVLSNGRRAAKSSEFECYFKTFEEARLYLIGVARRNQEAAERRAASAAESVKKLMNMKESDLEES